MRGLSILLFSFIKGSCVYMINKWQKGFFSCSTRISLVNYRVQHSKRNRINISIWATAHLPLPWPNINPSLLSIDYCWVRGGVGRQFPRYWYWPEKSISTRALVLFSIYVIELTVSETILLEFFKTCAFLIDEDFMQVGSVYCSIWALFRFLCVEKVNVCKVVNCKGHSTIF